MAVGIFEREVETEAYEVYHLLYGRGGQDDQVVVTVAAAFAGLEIVGL